MIVDLKSTKIYLISPGDDKYRSRLLTVFTRLVEAGFRRVEYMKSVPGRTGTISLSNTVLEIFEREMHSDEPFIIIEDDCALFHQYDSISIPEDGGMLYLGVSSWMYPHDTQSLHAWNRSFPIEPHSPAFITSHNEDLTRIKGMTSTHAIYYQSRPLMKDFINTMASITKEFGEGVPHDLVLAALQLEYPCYALKRPMFYQDNSLGGQEDVTKLMFHDNRYLPCR